MADDEQLAIPAGALRRSTLTALATLAVGGDIDEQTRHRLVLLGAVDKDGKVEESLLPLAAAVAQPAADVELLRASAGVMAEVHGWFSPNLVVMHTTEQDPDTVAPYVLTTPTALPQAVLHALAVPDQPAAPEPVELAGVNELLELARTGGASWAGQVGATEPRQLTLHRWDVAAPGRAAAVVRAIVSAPDGLRVLRHQPGPVLVPTDLATEEVELASVVKLLTTTTTG